MEKLYLTMIDGGLVNYKDDQCYYEGCPTCDYGSEYITEIDVTLTQYKIHISTNKMYDYALSEGDMLKIFLSNCNLIQSMTEKEFIDWLKTKLLEIVDEDEMGEYSVVEL